MKQKFKRLKRGCDELSIEVDISKIGAQRIEKANFSDVKPEPDVPVLAGEYVVTPMRLLSAGIITGYWYPIDFSKSGVLEAAVNLFSRGLYTDHWDYIHNCIGGVRAPRFNGKSKPAGIDADIYVLKDEKNKTVAVLVEDGFIDRCSVSVKFEWEQSHPNMDEDTFWKVIGEEVEGEIVRVVVTRIINIYEVSLVSFGADETAGSQDLDEVQYAHAHQKSNEKKLNKSPVAGKEVTPKMLEQLKALLAAHLGKVFTSDEDFKRAYEALLQDVAGIKQENETLKAEAQDLAATKKWKEDLEQSQRKEVLRLSKVLNGNKDLDADDADRYAAASYEKLTQYREDLEKKFPFTCQKCHSTDVLRRTSIEDVPNENPPIDSGAMTDFKTIHDQVEDWG